MELTAERLRELLHYDPGTGVFTHLTGFRKGRTAGRIRTTPLRKGGGYVQINVGCVGQLAHRLAWLYVFGTWPRELDHIDGNRANNVISNLRQASGSQNMANRGKQKNNTSGFKGAFKHQKGGRWFARIKRGNEHRYLGTFDTARLAHAAYAKAAAELFGEFARPE